ncbi:MAG: hypothetical protein AAB451_02030 [Patescibacteria group bacterium]
MAKVKVKDEESLKKAKENLRGGVNFRKTKWGVVAAGVRRPRKKVK